MLVMDAEQINDANLSEIGNRSFEDLSGIYPEILVHDIDTDSNPGSEDLEIISHRYDHGTTSNKHIYMNRLSLAAELLRTHETLPYDDEFKLVVQNGTDTDHNEFEDTPLTSANSDDLQPSTVNSLDGDKKEMIISKEGQTSIRVVSEVPKEEVESKHEILYGSSYRRFNRGNSALINGYAESFLQCSSCVII